MTNKKDNVVVKVGSDDVTFIINGKTISLLTLVKRLDSKVDKITYGGVLALVVGTVMAVPLFLTNKAFDKVDLQNKEIANQNKEVTDQNKKMLDYIIQLKVDQAVLTEKVRNLESK